MENKNTNVKPNDVPYIVYESEQARNERHIKRLWIAIVIAIIMIVVSNLAWLYAWCQYDYSSDETTTTTTYTQDGEGLNIIGSGNEVPR